MQKGIRDLILFFAFAGVPITSFLLQGYPNSEFFGLLLVIFLVILVWIDLKYDQKSYGKLLDYDENMTLSGILWVGMGIFATYLTAGIIVSGFGVHSSIVVPFQGLDWNYAGFELSGVWNDYLFNITLVAPAEELCKLVLQIALYLKLKEGLSEGLARFFAIVLPIGTWALLHSYSAYTGPNMPVLLMSAFVGGLIMYGVMYKTKSVLGAILTHAGYNCLILYIITMLAVVP